ncbi:MAG: T9SS type A sorting domain-containing protein [Candidatus Latescibacteria bacterium]|nr:T9SS type A sorting domain-containing protein [Candidatus Latescibacterota bacterium]
MKKGVAALLIVMFAATAASAADFAPTLLKLSADPVIQYDFDGSSLAIPVEVSGTTAGIIFCVFTKDMASEIPETVNGFLGWHQVNKVDTCVYYSTLKSVGIGSTTINWDGKDQDGSVVPAGEYTYYLWAFDNQGAKQKMSNYLMARSYYWEIQEVDTEGLPMANPFYYEWKRRWTLGGDPMDSTLVETTNVTLTEGWGRRYTPAVELSNFDYFYQKVINNDAGSVSINKFKWVPGGEAEFQVNFGNNGWAETLSTASGGSDSGVCTNGDYIFTSDRDNYNTETPVDFYIYDMDGFIISDIDLQDWWSSLEDQAAGAQANGGPNGMMIRNNKIFLNCHCSCIKQMVDPLRYLETEEATDFFVWTNRNGDYILDHNFEETANLKWACMDYNVGPYTYNLDADANLFSQCPSYDVGAVSFGLMAPDGTGIGYFAFSGETAGWKKSSTFVDSDTAFDGFYCDNEQAGGTHYQEGGWKANEYTSGLYFLGHDSISGVITNAVAVADEAPAAFSVSQNSPNPFNPTTTINFSLAQSGDVAVDVFNVAGQKIDTLVDGFMDAGQHSVVWNASGFSAGVYFYTVKSAGSSKTMKMTLVK